jgi:hypothetical protein
MDREAILKLLKSLGIKVTPDGAEGTMKEDDAVKLIEEQFKASNLGLVQKRDELLAEVAKQKEKITAMETAATETGKKVDELETQLQKNSPEENKKYYDAQLAEAEAKHKQELSKVTEERDKFRDSHYTRVRKDAIAKAIENIKFIDDAHREGFIAIAETQNKFVPIDPNNDGNIIFTNQENKTIQAKLHELSLSDIGKAFIQNGNKGGNAQGGNNPGVTGKGGQTMDRADFMNLSSAEQMEFSTKGGIVTD